MKVNFTRPEACRLYSLLGHVMRLQQICEAPAMEHATEEREKREKALAHFSAEIKGEMSYPGASHWECMNNLQNDVYYALTHNDEHVQEQTAALRRHEKRIAIRSIRRQVADLLEADS